jgi:plasmid stabilization system protein ParE
VGEGAVQREAARPPLSVALKWTSKAHSDLVRLHEFLEPVNPVAAARIVRHLVAGAKRIPTHPRLGLQMPEFSPREVRKLLVADYEIRYELTNTNVFILRIFHTREDR